MFRRFLEFCFCILMVFSFSACGINNDVEPAEKVDAPHTLRFNKDGKFKIVIFSDIHSDTENAPGSMAAILDVEKPDLVLIGGDTISWQQQGETEQILETLIAPIIERGIKWCYVYGNHDREFASARYLQRLYRSQEKCIASDVEYLDGEGTYCLPVLAHDSDEPEYVIWCMDSHDYANALGSYYDCVHTDQVEWYKQKSEEFEKTSGKKLFGMMFMHIPMQQLQYIADNYEECSAEGEVNEPICCSELDYGLFDAIKTRGDVKLVLNGHDHSNNYIGTVDGIRFGYCGTVTTTVPNIEEIRGARVVVIDENDTAHPETYMAFLHDPKYGYNK